MSTITTIPQLKSMLANDNVKARFKEILGKKAPGFISSIVAVANSNTLLQKAIDSIVSIKEETDIESLFSVGETTALKGEIKGLDDFELITFLIIKEA